MMWGMKMSRPAPATVTLTAGVVVVTLTMGLVVEVVLVPVVPGAVAVAPGAVAVVPAVVVVVVVVGKVAIVAVFLRGVRTDEVAEVEVEAVAADAAARLELALPRGVVMAMVDSGGDEVDRLGEDVVICFCDVKENGGG